MVGGLALATQATAQTTILIEGDVRNGNFDTTAPGAVNDGDRPFSDTAYWTKGGPTFGTVGQL